MMDWESAIAQANEQEIEDVLLLVLNRYRQLYTHGEMQVFWVDYGRTVYDQIDSFINSLENVKRRLGPVLVGPKKQSCSELRGSLWKQK